MASYRTPSPEAKQTIRVFRKPFWSRQDGNVAILTALTILIMFVLAGGAVDIIRMTTLRAELQEATDSAVLAAASLANAREPETVARDYFDNNFDETRYGLATVDFNPVATANSLERKAVRATARAEMPTVFLGILDIINGTPGRFGKLAIEVSSEATESEQFLEVALVVDISGSMSGPKIATLRSASETFIDRIFDDSEAGQTSFSLIPFSANVNIDPLFADFADTSALTVPVAKPCLLYEDEDFDRFDIPERSAVDQAGTGEIDQCAPTAAIFNTDNRIDLVNTANSLSAGGRTDGHIGLMWGLKALSPDLRGRLGGTYPDRPLALNDKTVKVLVVMSDGDLNPADVPDAVTAFNNATATFEEMCDDARNDDILVFTIGFQIAPGSAADSLLSACATSVSQYYFVETADLNAAFNSIAISIQKLRITA